MAGSDPETWINTSKPDGKITKVAVNVGCITDEPDSSDLPSTILPQHHLSFFVHTSGTARIGLSHNIIPFHPVWSLTSSSHPQPFFYFDVAPPRALSC